MQHAADGAQQFGFGHADAAVVADRRGDRFDHRLLGQRVQRIQLDVQRHVLAAYEYLVADRAQAALEDRFWLEEQGWFADVLLAPAGPFASGHAFFESMKLTEYVALIIKSE